MSDGVLWEYSAAEDVAIVPYSVRSVLVDQMRTPGFSDSAYAQGTVHPEDLPRLEQFRRELREGKPHILFEFRARQPGGGEYRWHRAEGVTLCDADGRRRVRSGVRRTSTGKAGAPAPAGCRRARPR